ncbi:MAG TPA: hypothetical protein DCO68_12430 [Methylophilaceae bacterium]|nr:hypothetical protein [Methylophilaceae bacterium]
MRQHLDLDFVESSHFALGKLHVLSAFILCLGIAAAVLVIQRYQTSDEAYQTAQSNLHEIHPEKKEPVIRVERKPVSAEEIKNVREAVSLLSTPWSTLFSAIEQINMKEVALLSIEPSTKKQLVVFTGQAKNIQAALTYIERLEALPMLTQVYLQRHNIDQQDPFKPVSFTIVAQWS